MESNSQSNKYWLIVHGNNSVREDLAFLLSSQFQNKCDSSSGPKDAIAKIKDWGQAPELILIEDSSEIALLRKYLAKNRMQPKLILISEATEQSLDPSQESPYSALISPTRLAATITAVITKVLGRSSDFSDSEFCPIPTSLLERISPVQGDVWIRLGRDKYVRLFSTNDHCSASDIERYAVRKGVTYLYVQRNQAPAFLQAVNRHLEIVLERLTRQMLSSIESEVIAAEAIDSIQAYVLRFGFTEDAREVADKAVKITEHTLSENAKLSHIFRKFMFHQNRYSALHSIVLAHVASAIASELQWTASGTLYKIILAAIFHDITLANENLAKIGSLRELEDRSGEFTDKERELFRLHPQHATMLIEKFKNHVPPEVEQIILQHHELPDGSGFPRGLTAANISPLSAVFMVSHEIVRKLILNKSTFSMEEEFLGLVKKFDHGSVFHSILNILDPYNSKQKNKIYG